MKKLLQFGDITSKRAITILFYIFIIPIIIKVYLTSKALCGMITFIARNIFFSPLETSQIIDIFASSMNNTENSKLLGLSDLGNPVIFVVIFILLLAVSFVVWKIICELLLKVFEYFESNKRYDMDRPQG